MPSKFGGIPVSGGSKFGGVPVEEPSPIVGDGETIQTLRLKFWQASRDGDKASAVAALRRLRAEGANTGSPPDMTGDAARKTADSDSMGVNAVAGLGEGARKATRGIAQASAMLNPTYWMVPEIRSRVDNLLPDNPTADRALNHTVMGMTQNITGQAVPFAVAPEVSGVRGAMGLAAAQGFAAPLPTGQNTLPNRLIGASIAAPLGGFGYAATRSAANKAAGMAGREFDDEARATIEAAQRLQKRTGVKAPLTAGDLGSPNVRQLQDVVFENTPLSGRVREMTRQQNAVTAGVTDLKARFPATADQPEAIMQKAMLEQQTKAKKQAGLLYDAVDTASREQGVPGVKTGHAAAALIDGLKAYPELLNSIGNSVTRNKINQLISRGPLSTSFANTREIMGAVRSELAEAQKRLASGAAGAKDSVLHLGRLSKALEADQQLWAQQAGGKTYAALKQANEYFQKNVAPFRNQRELRSVVAKDANPEGLLRASQDSYETAARRMAAMTPEGQDAYRRGLIQKAVEAGTRDDGKLNLLTLVNNLPNGRAAEQIFSKADLEVINDLARYAKAVDRSLNVGNTPLTGKQVAKLTPAIAAGGAATAAGGFPAVAGGVVLTNLARRVASSKTLRTLLHTAPVESQLGKLAAQRVSQPMLTAAGSTYALPWVTPRVENR